MSLADLTLLLVMVMFGLITIIFSLKYCNLLKMAENEYGKAKDVVKTVVLFFSRRQEEQSEVLGKLRFQTEVMQAKSETFLNQ